MTAPLNGEMDQLRQLLPWYLNGTLPANDRERIERALAQYPALSAELSWLKQLGVNLRATRDSEPNVNSALAEFWRRDATRQIQLSGTLRGGSLVIAPRWWKLVLGLSMSLAVLQAIPITWYLLHSDRVRVELLGKELPPGENILQVTFKPDAKEAEIRSLLLKANATIIRGPSELGVYHVEVKKEDVAHARKELEAASSLVERVD